ncbi:hypothetical protein [Pseudobacteriovorax antillogorgiicola]|uniref:Uncharacterized protein n=1 Tax=Pseudobacteriovorax antillogorgiicola TaxID=1513793 RepID=A0A1Y6CQ67_9BACT|nr:hypothetical protein [Pseudobacteriovorax antillogorgiicola]TCS42206.1 hypothetical protein EDD56_1433 [Pseudobacteriovorax antillogorgiicola]SMF82883.1 hypothetical protein SAMN06296036_14324 [Pseudobacteriovorax antillogorgiicola]
MISDPNLRSGIMIALCLVPYLLDSIFQHAQKFFLLSRYVGRALIYIIGPISINMFFLDANDRFNYWPAIATVLLIASANFLPGGDQSKRHQHRVTALYLGLLSLFLCLSIEIQTDSTLTRQILGAGSFFTLSVVLARICLLQGITTLFNGVTAAISVRVIVLYLEVFGNLLTTGIGLILSGLVILMIMWVWNKTRLKTFSNKGTHHE